MANLATARTRLGLFGYATRKTGSFDRAVVVLPGLGLFGGYVDAEDAVVTLLAAGNGNVILASATDEVVPLFVIASNVGALLISVSDENVTEAAAFDA